MAYYSHDKMIRYLKKFKKFDINGKIMALDIGRKYIGSAVSCNELKKAIPYKTFEIDPQYNRKEYDFGLHNKFYDEIANEFRKRKIKALIIGYPLSKENEITPMCKYIENFVETTKEAAIKILRQQQSKPDEYFLGSLNDSLIQKGTIFGDHTKHELMYKKTVYDVLAAQCILEKFLKMYNEREENNDKTEVEVADIQNSDDEQDINQTKNESKYL